jgi:hypothetical protein
LARQKKKKQGEVRSFTRVRANADIFPLLLLLHYNAAIWRCACAMRLHHQAKIRIL